MASSAPAGGAPPEKRARTETSSHIVAFPGEEGSLAHIAATRFFSGHPEASLQGVTGFAEAFARISSGKAHYAVLPIENSSSGSIAQTYNLLAQHNVVIGGELGIRESYNICAKEGVELNQIKRLLSHPNILEACSVYTETRLPKNFETLATVSTTEAARRVSQEDATKLSAVIATREAAKRFGLKVLASNIGNDTLLETRYILLHSITGETANRPAPFPREAVSPVRKHSACFVLRNEPSAIFKLMSCWALRNIDVLKVETRPLPVGPKAPSGIPSNSVRLWDHVFYVDYAVPPGQTDEASAALWAALKEFSLWQRDLGIYPSQTTRAEKTAQSWEEMVDIMTKA